jgi:hypothetical protein
METRDPVHADAICAAVRAAGYVVRVQEMKVNQ